MGGASNRWGSRKVRRFGSSLRKWGCPPWVSKLLPLGFSVGSLFIAAARATAGLRKSADVLDPGRLMEGPPVAPTPAGQAGSSQAASSPGLECQQVDDRSRRMYTPDGRYRIDGSEIGCVCSSARIYITPVPRGGALG